MPKNTPHVRRHGPDPHGERTADMELSLEDTKCGKLRFRHADFTDARMESRQNTPATTTSFACFIPLAIHANSVSSCTSSVHNKRLMKFNVKVITDYLLTLLSLT